MKPITISAPGSERVDVDLMKLVDTRLLVQANSGGGKSGTLRLIAERAAGQIQTIILDNEGEFATLREKIDVLLVGDGGELAADVRSAGLLARRLLETQVSAVVDLYELALDDRRKFVRGFLESLIALPRNLWRPTLIMIDEAHLYAPQGGDEESTRAVIALQSQGRKRGYCGILATQRLSKLHKDAAAECNNVLIGRTWLDVDQKRAADVLGMSKQDQVSLRDLETREFFGFGPAFSANGVFKTKTADVVTTMPKAGHRFEVAVPPPSSKVRALLQAEFSSLPDEAEAQIRDLDAAKKKIAQLERDVKAKPQPPAVPASERDLSRVKAEVMKEARTEWSSRVKVLEDKLRGAQSQIVRVGRLFAKAFEVNEQIAGELQKIDATPVALPPITAPTSRPRREPRPARIVRDVSGDGAIPRGERATLIACAQFDGATREELTVLTGYKRSSRDAYIQRLRERGYVEQLGEKIAATEEGIAALGADYEPLPVGSALREYWMTRLPEGERAVLAILADAYPDAVERTAIDDATGYKRSSRDAYLQRLYAKRLVTTDRGQARAREMLFD